MREISICKGVSHLYKEEKDDSKALETQLLNREGSNLNLHNNLTLFTVLFQVTWHKRLPPLFCL